MSSPVREGSEEYSQLLLQALSGAVFATNTEGRTTFFNAAAAELAVREPILGSDLWWEIWRLYSLNGSRLPQDQGLRAISAMQVLVERADGTRVPCLAYSKTLHDATEMPTGAVNLLVDIGERAQSERDMRTQMHELVHRVKNDMQVLRSLLSAAERETESEEAREVLADAARRVSAIAAVQHGIHVDGAESFDTRSFLEALGRNASQSFGRKADIEIEAASGALPNQTALPLALIVNELVTNAVKHGRGERNRVSIKLSLVNDGKVSLLSVQDDGRGFTPSPPRHRASGLGLVTALAGQLGGKLEMTADHGARCVLRFGNSS